VSFDDRIRAGTVLFIDVRKKRDCCFVVERGGTYAILQPDGSLKMLSHLLDTIIRTWTKYEWQVFP